MSKDLLDPDPGHTGYWEMHMGKGGAFPLGISATGVLMSLKSDCSHQKGKMPGTGAEGRFCLFLILLCQLM